jgi:ribose/xylose/arabinose/galactoside ABC-type transport system permease subunit
MGFVFCGFMGVIAGWMWLGRTNSIDVSMARGVTFDVIAAAVMGGISMRGGRGNVLMAWSGILLLTLISNGLNLNDVPSTYVAAARGILIFLACLLDGLRNRGAT